MVSVNETIRLRPMAVCDVPAVAALEAETFADPWSQRLYEETLESGRYDCRVLEQLGEDAGELLGYFAGQRILDEAEVHRIAVKKASRGKGYGQRLLEDFLTRMRRAGAETVFLEVRAGNEAAIGLYRKNGFTQSGIRRGYYHNPSEDAVLMQKRLSESS